MTTHLHITAWALAIILLIITVALYGKGNKKGGKITHMILRLDYLLILYSGGSLLSYLLTHDYSASYGASLLPEVIVKGLAGLWVIVAMELICVKTGKDKPAKGAWIQLIIAFIITLVLGFWRLPLSV